MGNKIKNLSENMLTTLMASVGPKRFVEAMIRATADGDAIDDSETAEVVTDEMLKEWVERLTELKAIAKWMEGGKKPKFVVKFGASNEVFTPWVVTTRDLAKLIKQTVGLLVEIDGEDDDAEHRFNVLTYDSFVMNLRRMRADNDRICDLQKYLREACEIEILYVSTNRPNTRLQTL